MAKGYSSDELRQIRIVNNLINRVNRLGEVFGNASLEYQKGANLLFEMGLAPINGTFKKPTNKQIVRMGLSKYTLTKAEHIKTSQQVLNKTYKKIGVKSVTIHSKEQAIERVKNEYEIATWIEHNIESIYEYEQKYGNVITGHSGSLTYEELENIKNNIESSDVNVSGWGWTDEDEFPDE